MQLLASFISIKSFLSNVYFADFFDVAIIAILIYIVIFLFKQSRSFYVAFGIAMAVALYIFAQVFNLHLTSLVLQSFFGVFLISLVVIFQEELRRFFELIAVWSTRQAKNRPSVIASPFVAEIVNAVKQLARAKTGALIVFAGNENIDRYLSGGRMLDGLISEELLLSIFDPTSLGHDGAVIIQNDRVVQFSAHLPLSHNFDELGKKGTRHSASLGIAEVSDSFAVVVSEERGVISYAYKGKLKSLKDPDELLPALNSFMKEKYPVHAYTVWENLIKRNSLEKLFAILVSVVLWFFFSFNIGTVQRDFIVPITYKNLQPDLVIQTTEPNAVSVTLLTRGKSAFDLLDPKTLTVSIDASNLTVGKKELTVVEKDIVHPLNFSVANITPNQVEVTVQKFKEVAVPVEIKTKGQVASGYEIKNTTLTPQSVKILIPQSVEAPQSITTNIIDLTGLKFSMTTTTRMILPKDAQLKELKDTSVSVTFDIRKK